MKGENAKNGDKARQKERRGKEERTIKEERDIVKVNKKERNTEKMGGREIGGEGGENTETDGQTRRLKEVMERKGDRV